MTKRFDTGIPVVPPESDAKDSRDSESNRQVDVYVDVVLQIFLDRLNLILEMDRVQAFSEVRELKEEVMSRPCNELFNDTGSAFRSIYEDVFPKVVAKLNELGVPFALQDQDAYSEDLVVTPKQIREAFYFIIHEGQVSVPGEVEER